MFSLIAAAAANALAGFTAAKATTKGQPGVQFLGAYHPTDSNGQHRNPKRAALRRRVKAWGGRRQYLKTVKGLRRMRADVMAQPD